MKLYRLTQIELERPVTIIAKDSDHAASMVVAALARAFGQLPDIFYTISEWRSPPSRERDMLAGLVALGDAGFVEKHERFWEVFDPFDLW